MCAAHTVRYGVCRTMSVVAGPAASLARNGHDTASWATEVQERVANYKLEDGTVDYASIPANAGLLRTLYKDLLDSLEGAKATLERIKRGQGEKEK
jgi:hypothetical protein